MNKTVKILSTILLAIMLVATIVGTVYAADPLEVITGVEEGGKDVDGQSITDIGGNITAIIQVVGVVIAIIIILVIGIKYLIGSAEEKAEYKKTMIPYLVGAILIFAGTSIVRVVYSMTSQIKA